MASQRLALRRDRGEAHPRLKRNATLLWNDRDRSTLLYDLQELVEKLSHLRVAVCKQGT